MADGNGGGSNSASIVAIIAILVLVIIVAYVLLRGNLLGGRGRTTGVNVNISTPSSKP